MVINAIREMTKAVPFVPYEIRMASGDRYVVPHPDFILIAPRGSYVIVVDEEERPHHLSAIVIEAAAPVRGKHKKA